MKNKEYDENDNGDKKSKPVYSVGIVDGEMITEMIVADDTTEYAYLYNGDRGICHTAYSTQGIEYIPYPIDNNLIQNHIVEFPSRPESYISKSELFEQIRTFIHKYVDIPEDFEIVCSYYVMLTWIYDRFHELPYLRVIGDYGTGKSRLIKTVGNLCYRPIKTMGATNSAGIFRLLNDIRGTLLFDEADLRSSDTTDTVVKILNAGYEKGNGLIRMEKLSNSGPLSIKSFQVYGPKIIGTREPFTDRALESRCLTERMGKSSIRNDIPRNLDDSFYAEARHIRNMLLSYRFDTFYEQFEGLQTLVIGVHPRLQQIALPILALIENESHRATFMDFMVRQNDELIADQSDNWEAEIVKILLSLKKHDIDQVSMKDISDLLNKYRDPDDTTWSPKKVGWLIKKKLALTRTRITRGYVVSISANAHKVDMYRERFGITDQDIQMYLNN